MFLERERQQRSGLLPSASYVVLAEQLHVAELRRQADAISTVLAQSLVRVKGPSPALLASALRVHQEAIASIVRTLQASLDTDVQLSGVPMATNLEQERALAIAHGEVVLKIALSRPG